MVTLQITGNAEELKSFLRLVHLLHMTELCQLEEISYPPSHAKQSTKHTVQGTVKLTLDAPTLKELHAREIVKQAGHSPFADHIDED